MLCRLYLGKDTKISRLAGSFQKGRREVPEQVIVPDAPGGKEAGTALPAAPEARRVHILEGAFRVAPVPGIRAHHGFFKHRLLVGQLQLLELLIDLLHVGHGGARGQAAVGLCVLGTETEDGLQALSLLQHRRGEGQRVCENADNHKEKD